MKKKDSSIHVFGTHDEAEDAVRTLTASGLKEQMIKYETTLKKNNYVVMVHGSAEQVVKARSILAASTAWKTA